MATRMAAMLAALLAALTAADGAAQDASVHWSVPLRTQIARLNAVDWRLATTAKPRCIRITSGTGLALDSLAAYPQSERAAIAAALGMGNGIVVAGVAPGSPGEAAGFAPGDRLVAIAGSALAVPGDTPLAADEAERQLASLPADVAVLVTVERSGTRRELALVPVPRCAARSILVPERKVDAWSDADNLALTTGMLDFARSDDELALVAAHELAHVILDPDLRARGIRAKRKEDAADTLGAQIAACAGYDLALASALWSRFDAARPLGFLPSFTHRASGTRGRAIASMAGQVDCAQFASPAR